MIVTVTLNPLLEKRATVSKFVPGEQVRTQGFNLAAGGKGINVSRQLKQMDVDSISPTFVGGSTGRSFLEAVNAERLEVVPIRTKSETREGFVIIEESSHTFSTFFGASQEILDHERDEFITKLKKIISNAELIVLSGSSPGGNADTIFPELIRFANELGKTTFLDTYGEHLAECIEAGPTVMHNNVEELSASLQRSNTNEEEIRETLGYLYSKGVKQAFITDGGGKLYCSAFDFHYTVTPPSIKVCSEVGSGDAFVAGIVYGWYKDMVFADMLKLACGLGAGNAEQISVCAVSQERAHELAAQTVITSVGKPMKILDVTPTI